MLMHHRQPSVAVLLWAQSVALEPCILYLLACHVNAQFKHCLGVGTKLSLIFEIVLHLKILSLMRCDGDAD